MYSNDASVGNRASARGLQARIREASASSQATSGPSRPNQYCGIMLQQLNLSLHNARRKVLALASHSEV